MKTELLQKQSKVRKLISATSAKIGNKFLWLSQLLEQDKSQKSVCLKAWYKNKCDQTLRLEYENINEKSIVFDLGGYEGQWSSDIFAKYCCLIHVFEPVEKFAKAIENRFSSNPKIVLHNFGLASENGETSISVDEDKSSMTRELNGKTEKIQLKTASKFIEDNCIYRIDLIKINIEGAEYDLLEHLIDSGYIKIIKNIQVQFHDFVPEAESRMKEIQRKLSETHQLKWQYYFVWESWEHKDWGIDS